MKSDIMTKTTFGQTPLSETSEKAIERHLSQRVRAAGGEALKFASAVSTGWPDRICLMPGGRVFFAELKSKGKKPTKLQTLRIGTLRAMGFAVYVPDTREAADMALLREGVL